MHAYLIISDNKELDVKSLLPNLYEPAHKHFFSKIKIDDVRYLNNFLLTSGQESHIIYFDSFLDIAQNAFLKTLEEPNANKQIILVTKSVSSILDTMVSRLQIINTESLNIKTKNSFLSLNIIERLDVVKKILDGEADDVRPSAQKLINHILNDTSVILDKDQKQTLAEMHDHLFNQGSSAKQILEFLAVTL